MFSKRSGCLLFAGAAAVVIQLAPPGDSVAAAAPATCPASLSYGTTASCAIGAANEVDVFGLLAAAGDSALIHVVGAAGSGLDVDLDVRDPSKKVICSARAGASAEVLCPLPVAGRYAVSVFDAGGDETGAYRLDAQRVNRPVGAVGLSVARPREARLRYAGANDWYTFAGTAKTTMVVRAAAVGVSPIEADLDVYSPSGAALCATRAGVVAQVACALPTTGTYAVRVVDGADDEAGIYALIARPDCTITGTSGADTLTGTSGNDVICALGGADKVNGGAGDDIILGGTGNDTLEGGNGDDVFISERTADGRDTIAGGSGTDVLSYVERGNAISVSPNVKADDGESGEQDDIRADVETIIGGAGNDQLVGSAVNNTLIGEFGYDVLDGGAGTDHCDVGGDGGRVTACE